MSFKNIGPGEKAPEIVNVVIEIPKGSHNKYEYDDELDILKLDRVLYSAVIYPTDYGFIPQTLSEDGDHLDIMVFISEPVFPGCLLSAKPIGALNMEDEEGKDSKIVAVALNDPRMKGIEKIGDLESHYKKEIYNFFEVYKNLEKKPVRVNRWLSKKEAYRLIEEAIANFKKRQLTI